MSNAFKTFFLMTVLTVAFVFIGGILGGRTGAFIALIFAAGMNFYSYWFSDKLVLKRYKAREVGPEDNSRLYRIVENLSQRAGLPMPKVYIVPNKTPNAFATGRNPEHAAVAATTGILELLDDNELSGVIGHELAHVKNRDMLTGTIAASLAGAITMLGQFSRFSSDRRSNPLLSLFLIIGAPIAAMIIRMAISRVREYAADRGGAEISGKPLALANALNKLHHGVKRFPMQSGKETDSHLFIVNPFFGGMQKLFSTHPPVEERIRRLEELSHSIH